MSEPIIIETPASITYGDPTQPCMGMGICGLSGSSASPNAITVTLSAGDINTGLIVKIAADQWQVLSDIRPDIALAIATNAFQPAPNSNFFIDSGISQLLWPNTQGNDGAFIQQGAACSAQNTNQTWILTISPVGFGIPGGQVGQIVQPTMQAGQWQIGTDSYGNLCFITPNNHVILGINGNIDINDYNVVATPMG